jgi:hypothetical protein
MPNGSRKPSHNSPNPRDTAALSLQNCITSADGRTHSTASRSDIKTSCRSWIAAMADAICLRLNIPTMNNSPMTATGATVD